MNRCYICDKAKKLESCHRIGICHSCIQMYNIAIDKYVPPVIEDNHELMLDEQGFTWPIIDEN